MVERFVENDGDREMLIRFLREQVPPFAIALFKGHKRTFEQNRLQRMWMNEISEQLGEPAEYWRGYCKLTIGVPILRATSEGFREKYDSILKPLPYEKKIALMMEPLDLPVTRFMTTKQKTEYLDAVFKHFTEKGVVLTQPKEPH